MMKLFISWSGDISHTVAVALRDWLPSVLQSVEPYVSSEDLEKGARWSVEIGQQLEETTFGILCVTPQNVNSPWLNFEAGALSKSLDTSRVSPFLLGIRPAELVGPLAQFQATLPRVDDVVRLVKSINNVSQHPIEEVRLIDITQMWWPRLENLLKAALSEQEQTPQEPQRGTTEMIEELLEITRGLQRQIVHRAADEPRGTNEQEYLVRPPPTIRERKNVRAVLTSFLFTSMPEEEWEVHDDNNGVLIKFHKAPSARLLRTIDDVVRDHRIMVTMQVPTPTRKASDDLPKE
jgi:TIR domain